MAEIFNLLFYPLSNGVMTVLTGMSLLYWLFMLVSGGGFDFGTDADVALEGSELGDVSDVDGDVEGDTGEPGFFSKALDFISVGKAPIMVIVTLFKFVSWIITILSSMVFGVAKLGFWSILILLPVFIVTYFLMHWITKPIARFYSEIGYKGEEAHDFLGRTGKMRSTISGDKIGSAEFIISKDVIRLNVKSWDGSPINYLDEVMVVDEIKGQNIYLVQKEITLNTL